MTDVVLDGRAFLEGPRWRGDALYVSDMHAHEVLQVGLDGSVAVVATLDDAPSGLGWLPDGSLAVVSMGDRCLLRVGPDGSTTALADVSALAPHEINDLCVDGAGRAWISQFGYDLHGGGRPAWAPLIRVDTATGVAAVAAEDMKVANGLVATPDDRTLIVAESAGKVLLAFTIRDDGWLADRRVWAELPAHPDGICLDAEGAVWVACPVADRFVRVEEGGRVTETFEADGRHAIACALGGPDGRTLFCLTADVLGDPDGSRATRSARILATTVAVPGVERP